MKSASKPVDRVPVIIQPKPVINNRPQSRQILEPTPRVAGRYIDSIIRRMGR